MEAQAHIDMLVEIQHMFELFDQDSSGYIDFDESKLLFDVLNHHLHELGQQGLDEDAFLMLWRKIDVDKNNRVGLDEFIPMGKILIENHISASDIIHFQEHHVPNSHSTPQHKQRVVPLRLEHAKQLEQHAPFSPRTTKSLHLLKLKRIFDGIDKNHNGVIETEELVSAITSQFPSLDEEQVNKVISLWKLDEQRNVTFEQFAKIFEDSQGTSSIPPINLSADETISMQKLFDLIDTNHDGQISRDEMSVACMRLGVVPANLTESASSDYVNQVIKELDLNGDGKITFDEFCIGMRHFGFAMGLPASSSSELSEPELDLSSDHVQNAGNGILPSSSFLDNSEVIDLQSGYSTLEKKCEVLEENIQLYEDENKQLQQQCHQLKRELHNQKRIVNELQHTKNLYEASLKQQEEANEKIHELNNTIHKLKLENRKLQDTRSVFLNELNQKEDDLVTVEQHQKQLEQKIQQSKAQMESQLKKETELNLNLEKANSTIAQLENDIKRCRMDLQFYIEKENSLQSVIVEKDGIIQSLEYLSQQQQHKISELDRELRSQTRSPTPSRSKSPTNGESKIRISSPAVSIQQIPFGSSEDLLSVDPNHNPNLRTSPLSPSTSSTSVQTDTTPSKIVTPTPVSRIRRSTIDVSAPSRYKSLTRSSSLREDLSKLAEGEPQTSREQEISNLRKSVLELRMKNTPGSVPTTPTPTNLRNSLDTTPPVKIQLRNSQHLTDNNNTQQLVDNTRLYSTPTPDATKEIEKLKSEFQTRIEKMQQEITELRNSELQLKNSLHEQEPHLTSLQHELELSKQHEAQLLEALERNQKELKAYKNVVEQLQNRLALQDHEIESLKDYDEKTTTVSNPFSVIPTLLKKHTHTASVTQPMSNALWSMITPAHHATHPTPTTSTPQPLPVVSPAKNIMAQRTGMFHMRGLLSQSSFELEEANKKPPSKAPSMDVDDIN